LVACALCAYIKVGKLKKHQLFSRIERQRLNIN
jgi:hypothetical protein